MANVNDYSEYGFVPKQQNIPDYSEYGFVPKETTTQQSPQYSPPNQGIFNKVINTINAVGGTAARGLEYGMGNIVNPPIEAANYLNQKLAGLFGVKPEDVPTPDTIKPQPMPFVSQQNQENLEPDAKVLGEIPDIVGGAQLGLMGGKAALGKLGNLIGANADLKANNLVSKLLGNNNFSKSHLPILNEIRNNYEASKDASTSQYNDVLSNAIQQGYTRDKYLPGISVDTGEKSIVTNNFKNELGDIDLTEHSKNIQDLLNPINKSVNSNMSFANAHDLQSELGKEGAKLVTNADSGKRSLGGELLGLRDTLKTDITNSFAANGDNDLAQQYKSASDFFKNNVAPYRENTAIRNVVTKSGLKEVNPANIGNVLKKDDGSILPIVNQLSPESKNLLLANQLKNATQLLPQAGQMQRSTNAQALINAFGQLDNKGFSSFVTPESIQAIQDIQNDLSKQGNIKWIMDRLKIPIHYGAAAAGGTAGYHIARQFF